VKKPEKLKSKERICSEVSVNSLREIRGASPEEAKEGYCRKDLQKRKVLSHLRAGQWAARRFSCNEQYHFNMSMNLSMNSGH